MIRHELIINIVIEDRIEKIAKTHKSINTSLRSIKAKIILELVLYQLSDRTHEDGSFQLFLW